MWGRAGSTGARGVRLGPRLIGIALEGDVADERVPILVAQRAKLGGLPARLDSGQLASGRRWYAMSWRGGDGFRGQEQDRHDVVPGGLSGLAVLRGRT